MAELTKKYFEKKATGGFRQFFVTGIENGKTDNPKIDYKETSDGKLSLYLLFNFGSVPMIDEETGDPVLDAKGKQKFKTLRKKEFLKLYIEKVVKTYSDKQQNEETMELANKVRYEREQQFLQDREGYRLQALGETNMLLWWDEFVKHSKVADKRLLKGALLNFKSFLKEEYPMYAVRIESKQITTEMMQKFAYYLEDNHKGEGIKTYWARFKRLVNVAVDKDMMKKSPCKGVHVSDTSDILAKDILSMEELQRLFSTHYRGENPEIRRGFAITCLTGIRRCDVVRLTWGNVDFANRLLKFRQAKVERKSKHGGVTIPLSDTLLNIIGEKPKDVKDSDFIVKLPSMEMCLKALRHWCEHAEIDKHITWHCGRHSFATNLLGNGANIKVVSELLGHSTITYTEKYVRAVDELKKEAINSLPDIKL